MITHNQAVKLLAFAAAYDQRTTGEYDVDAWRMAGEPGRWSYDAVQRVIVEHYAADADRPRITPAMITDRLRTLRGRAAESFELPRIPDGLPNAQYPEWLRRQLAAHCDAILQRWADTGAEPPRGIHAAPAQVRSLPELVAAAPPKHRPVIGAGMKRLVGRRVVLDSATRAKARTEIERARNKTATPEPDSPEPDAHQRALIRSRIEDASQDIDEDAS